MMFQLKEIRDRLNAIEQKQQEIEERVIAAVVGMQDVISRFAQDMKKERELFTSLLASARVTVNEAHTQLGKIMQD